LYSFVRDNKAGKNRNQTAFTRKTMQAVAQTWFELRLRCTISGAN